MKHDCGIHLTLNKQWGSHLGSAFTNHTNQANYYPSISEKVCNWDVEFSE